MLQNPNRKEPKSNSGKGMALKIHKMQKKRAKTIPTNGAPEDLSGGTEVNGAMGGLGVHPLPQEAHVLHLLADQPAGDADLLAPDDDDFLAVEKLFGDNRREPSQHVMPCIDDNALGADTGTGHHFLVSVQNPGAAIVFFLSARTGVARVNIRVPIRAKTHWAFHFGHIFSWAGPRFFFFLLFG